MTADNIADTLQLGTLIRKSGPSPTTVLYKDVGGSIGRDKSAGILSKLHIAVTEQSWRYN